MTSVLPESELLSVFEGVPQPGVPRPLGRHRHHRFARQWGLPRGGGEARRALKENSVSVNRNKVTADKVVIG